MNQQVKNSFMRCLKMRLRGGAIDLKREGDIHGSLVPKKIPKNEMNYFFIDAYLPQRHSDSLLTKLRGMIAVKRT
jgi:hypothetical protein